MYGKRLTLYKTRVIKPSVQPVPVGAKLILWKKRKKKQTKKREEHRRGQNTRAQTTQTKKKKTRPGQQHTPGGPHTTTQKASQGKGPQEAQDTEEAGTKRNKQKSARKSNNLRGD
eukprot:gnl/MRDRNA2_/MRDRNA2_9422_c0_seq1.p2 gnl/MRDRNA2_/MRDRNA2_9422_c0~~gnl/MRDRNA2_/MRDRNA2_9422_c0_seq1.p2  ORF type:complete len:115 (+),score=19.65 gnl/MRDRNA2_/MRDRNA2_9422_c0_seq1:82-426(+)